MSTHTTPKVTEVSFCHTRKQRLLHSPFPGARALAVVPANPAASAWQPGKHCREGRRVCKKQQWALANLYVAWLSRDNAKCFMRIVGYSWSYVHLIKDVLLFPPLYRWENRGIERLSNLPRISQILKCTPQILNTDHYAILLWIAKKKENEIPHWGNWWELTVFWSYYFNQKKLFQYHVLTLSSNSCQLLYELLSHMYRNDTKQEKNHRGKTSG